MLRLIEQSLLELVVLGCVVRAFLMLHHLGFFLQMTSVVMTPKTGAVGVAVLLLIVPVPTTSVHELQTIG